MDKIKCEVIRDLMPLVADDVASEGSKELVNGHIEGCETCRAYYAGMTAQMVRMAMPDDGPTSTFVKFTHQMEKRVRMKKVLIALTAALVALCVAIVGGTVVVDKMNSNVHMDIEKTQAWLWRENYGEVNLAVLMNEGYGWYDSLTWYRNGDIFYLIPYEPEVKLWKKGNHGGLQKGFQLDLQWENGKLYNVLSVADDRYNAETDRFEVEEKEYKVPIRFVRWGDIDNFTTLYEEGDEIMTRKEVYELVYPSADDAEEAEGNEPAKTSPLPIATPVPAGKGD